jgi:glycosyltransferase involved in cell wall biosynthesis
MTASSRAITVILNAQIPPNAGWGGVEPFTRALVEALGQLDGPERYIVVGHPRDPGWLVGDVLGPNQRLVAGPEPRLSAGERAKRMLGPLRKTMGRLWRATRDANLGPPQPSERRVPRSDGFFEALGADLIHFPYPAYFRTSLPAIYNPHDLLHRHHPDFFSVDEVAHRESIYRAGCTEAATVAAESTWAKHDIEQQYNIDPARVHAIARGAPIALEPPPGEQTLVNVKRRLGLPDTFALYPAQTFPHKNHLRLLDALALLRQRHGQAPCVVCTGKCNTFYATIAARVAELNLGESVRFTDFVSAIELRAMYRLATCLVFPTLFEGGGFPLLEAFEEGLPAACSTATSLPEYGGDAALWFEPTSIPAIADALHRLLQDADLREQLRQRGQQRVRQYTWPRTARVYRALYRRVAGVPLADEDRSLLAA